MEKLVKQILIFYQDHKFSWPDDWMIKFGSILFAISLWYFVSGEDRVDMSVQVPVEIVNLPLDLVISNQFKNQLEVAVSGPRSMIRNLSGKKISRSIDLSKAAPGNMVIRNSPDSVSFPHGIKVSRIKPAQIILLLDRLIQKEVSIKYVTLGDPPEGYTLGAILLEPDKLNLSGPEAILGRERIIRTQPIDLTGMEQSTVNQVSLDLRPEVADLIGEPIITARITINKIVPEEIFPEEPDSEITPQEKETK